jgi:hypothetical protein
LVKLDEKAVATVLECAQLFEYNVDKKEWMELWMEADPDKDKGLAEHMWGKFTQRTVEPPMIVADLLNTIGHSDLHVSRILSRMVLIRCKKKDPDVLTRYGDG